jgi:HK97 family phage prohead protease
MSELERRFLTTDPPKATGRAVRGYAALYNTRSANFGTTDRPSHEVITRGAFDNVLAGDVVALFNHNSDIVLARSVNGSGTLKLGTDERGLWYEFEAPNTSAGNDLLESIKRGDINSSSFAFRVDEAGQTWTPEGAGTLRTIKKVTHLFDVSPVTTPAYAATSVSARALIAGPVPTPILNCWKRRFDLIKSH